MEPPAIPGRFTLFNQVMINRYRQGIDPQTAGEVCAQSLRITHYGRKTRPHVEYSARFPLTERTGRPFFGFLARDVAMEDALIRFQT
jgi:hypothetical protein